jgi:eukaryotic-like serine/threonine-protein kinase
MESSLTRRCELCGYRYDSATEFCPLDMRPLPAPDPAVADLGVYRLLERLGDGGMGSVYRAVHTRLGRSVAIKLLQKELSSDRGIINRFFHEARAANTIRHEHVIEVYDFVETGEDIYFVMEFLKGEDLHEAIHHRGLEPMEALEAGTILEQIASALHATHARDIVHRDLKPENVFLAERDGARDFVKVFDFGVAKLHRPDGRSTIEGAVLGTPEYMSPEQARGGPVDGRADIYSLGCVAYEMLTRRQIFGGGTQAEILVRQLSEEVPPLRSFVPSIPPALDEAVRRALIKDPGRRTQTARAFAEDVAQALGRDLEQSAAFRAISRPTEVRARSRSGLVLREDRRRWLVPIAVGALAASLLAAGLGFGGRSRPVAGGPAPVAAAPAGAPLPALAPPPAPGAGALDRVTVLLQSIPSGAQILDERGEQIGFTPHDLVLPRGGERALRFQLSGFLPADRRFQVRTDATIAVRLDPDARGRGRSLHPPGHKGARASAHLDSTATTIDPFVR